LARTIDATANQHSTDGGQRQAKRKAALEKLAPGEPTLLAIPDKLRKLLHLFDPLIVVHSTSGHDAPHNR
jgi:hypothetical protein